MICKKCGVTNLDTATVCISCGENLEDSPIETNSNEATEVAETATPEVAPVEAAPEMAPAETAPEMAPAEAAPAEAAPEVAPVAAPEAAPATAPEAAPVTPVAPVDPNAVQTPPVAAPAETKKSKTPLIIVIVLVVACIALAVVLILQNSKTGKEEPKDETTTTTETTTTEATTIAPINNNANSFVHQAITYMIPDGFKYKVDDTDDSLLIYNQTDKSLLLFYRFSSGFGTKEQYIQIWQEEGINDIVATDEKVNGFDAVHLTFEYDGDKYGNYYINLEDGSILQVMEYFYTEGRYTSTINSILANVKKDSSSFGAPSTESQKTESLKVSKKEIPAE